MVHLIPNVNELSNHQNEFGKEADGPVKVFRFFF